VSLPVSKRVQRVKPSPTVALTGRVAQLKAEGKDIIGLGAGEPDFDTPTHIADAGVEAIRKGHTRYTAVEGTAELKDAIIAKFKRENGLDYARKQVLVSSGDAYIIDFEGEPARPLAERRAKMSPMVDVAGLMRSLDYAVATTLDPRTPTSAPLPEATRAKFVKRLRDGAQDAFLEAYRAGAAELPGLDNMDLLNFFMLEKAAYELVYEASNRPAWITIPLHGLQRLMGRILGEETRSVS